MESGLGLGGIGGPRCMTPQERNRRGNDFEEPPSALTGTGGPPSLPPAGMYNRSFNH